MIETAIVKHLQTVTAVTSLVGASSIYVDRLPDGQSLPYISIFEVSHIEPVMGRVGISRIQCDCFAGGYSDGRAISEVVISALKGYCGTMQGERIEYIEFTGRSDQYIESLETHQFIVEFKIKFRK